jgi:hypothetical protein
MGNLPESAPTAGWIMTIIGRLKIQSGLKIRQLPFKLDDSGQFRGRNEASLRQWTEGNFRVAR